ncbi:hypothetical protein EWM64_g5359 [Hericium alpestre]|uniref:Uncharacterized protein n=1 Tax=Hericium alpestre TaxID=135208 RepID=A0A4Y9ZXA3_9AGAM|nr:hypothetical protein EWM64_g5359 [Hericium alpestre]
MSQDLNTSLYPYSKPISELLNDFLKDRGPFPFAPSQKGPLVNPFSSENNPSPSHTPHISAALLDKSKRVPKLDFDPARLVVLERVPIYKSDDAVIFLVAWDGQPCVLKVNHLTFDDMDRAEIMRKARETHKENPKELRRVSSSVGPPDRFAQELAVYNRLLQGGVCQTGGPVPQPLGWFEIPDYNDPFWLREEPSDNSSPPNAPSSVDIPTTSKEMMPYNSWLEDFKYEMRPPRALLLEYIPNARTMSPAEMTPEHVRKLFEGLQKIHSAQVTHGDIAPRNILVEGSRVVFVDFESSVIEKGRPKRYAWEIHGLFDLFMA